MKYDVSLTVETISMSPHEIERELEQRLLDSSDLLIGVDSIRDKFSGDLSLARRRVTKHFFDTPFLFGFSHAHNIAYGIGWGSALLKMVLVDFSAKTVLFEKTLAASPHDTVIKKKFKTMEGCFKLLPKTEAEFNKVIEKDQQYVNNVQRRRW